MTLVLHSSPTLQRAGGGRPQGKQQSVPSSTPLAVVNNQKIGTAEGYREKAIADGIAYRPDGLFSEDDAVLLSLIDRGLHPFEKHLPGFENPYEVLPEGGWITGNESCIRGIDLRLFYQAPAAPEEGSHGTLAACLKFGEGASIGSGFFLSAHGGAIETVLDEATAELGKMEFCPFLSTVEANFKIKKVVPLFTTLLIRCEIVKCAGIRCWVRGTLLQLDGEKENVLATCEATLVNMVPFLQK